MSDTEQKARQFVERILPDPVIRKAVLLSLADAIAYIHQYSKACWGISADWKLLWLQFTSRSTPYIWLVGDGETGKVTFHLDKDDVLALTDKESELLEKEANLTTEDSLWNKASLCLPRQDDVSGLVEDLFKSFIHKQIGSKPKQQLGKRYQTTHREFGAGVIEYMRTFLDKPDIPQPAWYTAPLSSAQSAKEEPMATFDIIDRYLKDRGYYFTKTQIASFYTALQTKGFVILSGISGTGKTKLAQKFAEMLPVSGPRVVKPPANIITIKIQPDHLLRRRFIIPSKYLPLFQPIEPNKRIDIDLRWDGNIQKCSMRLFEYPGRSPFLLFGLLNKAADWITQNYQVGDLLYLQPEFEGDQVKSLTILPVPDTVDEPAEDEHQTNCLFLSVRPDWRDSKSLLGYYNPLTKTYQWTPFLKFLIKAHKSYEAQDGYTWFVILDEMNLARVEYYFADLLSVLESGRDDNGYTTEALHFGFDEMDGEDAPPDELKLPPNLYIVGTVNVDETTQSFSPKVLDRAFSIEFVDVSFTDYRLQNNGDPFTPSQQQRQTLEDAFTRHGVFARIDKAEISQFSALDQYRLELDQLNRALQPYNMHFGYRVFDEIIMFLRNAEENGMFGSNLMDAFDQSVLMKVLPKFHGSRGKLDQPLRAILRWCAGVDADDTDPVKTALADPGSTITDLEWKAPATARRVLRMVQSLNSTGFASFG